MKNQIWDKRIVIGKRRFARRNISGTTTISATTPLPIRIFLRVRKNSTMIKSPLQKAITTLISVFLILIFASPAFSYQAYKWVDKDGNINYGDSPLNARKAEALNLNSKPPPITESERQMRRKSEQIYELQQQEREEKHEAARKRTQRQREIRQLVINELQRHKFGPPTTKIPYDVTLINPHELDRSRDEKCRIYRELVRRLSKPVSRRDYLHSEISRRRDHLKTNKLLMRHYCQ